MTKEEYIEKLKHPKWKQRRLEILTRKGLVCYCCGDAKSYLDIHHRKYITHGNPWDSPDEDLIPVCRKCHNIISSPIEMKKLRDSIGRIIKHNDGMLFLLNAFIRESKRVEELKSTLNG